jgi:hypothetical protein
VVAACFEILPDDIEETRKNPFIDEHLRKQIKNSRHPEYEVRTQKAVSGEE